MEHEELQPIPQNVFPDESIPKEKRCTVCERAYKTEGRSMCQKCIDDGWCDMTESDEAYKEGLEAIQNDPLLRGKIMVESPFIKDEG